jgi:xylose isomerase
MSQFKYSVGPWNVHEGADSYGPATRKPIGIETKIAKFKEIGFDAIQFHDDDAVPGINSLSEKDIIAEAQEMKTLLDKHELKAEFVAPRLWMDPRTVDGGYTSNNPADREFALWRTLRSIDIANALGCGKIVLWLAREGTLCFESKNPVESVQRLLEAVNAMLAHDKKIKILIETKPNEPVDRSVCPTIGHALAISAASDDPTRVGTLLESAHAILSGLDPAGEIAFALALGKLWGVHLNDQNGLRFDQDKSFGVENLRMAFNQIKVLLENNYGANGEYVGLDVKVMRTEKDEGGFKHLENSLRMARILEEKAKKFDNKLQSECVAQRDYERLEMYIMELLMGV